MYPWATPENLLYGRTFDQLIRLYNEGWAAQKTSAKIFWGVLGDIMQGGNPDKKTTHGKTDYLKGLKEFKEAHPEAQTDNGRWELSK